MFKLLEQQKQLLSATALWPERQPNLVYKVRLYITLLITMFLSISMTINAIYCRHDIIKLSESFYVFITVIASVIKVFMLVSNKEKFLKLIDKLEANNFSNYLWKYGNYLDDACAFFKRLVNLYRIVVAGCLIFMALFPILENKPLPLDFPFFNDGDFHYPFYLFEIIAVSLAAHNNMSLDLLAVGIIHIGTLQLSILNNKLVDTYKNIKKPSNDNKNIEKCTLRYLNNCCQHYVDIEEYIKLATDLLSVHIFFHLGGNVVAICNSGLRLVGISPFTPQAVWLFLYTIMLFFQSAIYCWFGNQVFVKSLEVNNSCYSTEWYHRGPAVRKTMFLLMERAKRPFEIKGCKFVSLSFDTLIAIAKSSYSAFTLLRNTMQNSDL